ncbi:hypothetical protein BJ944DRAFT_247981 [Cunninghamella echinulata]|nr:hypothetical protein BJ944DRAFT_247981 [Cunninghamella echinulata]
MTELISLPTELIMSICSFLDTRDLSKLRLVNRKLNIIVDQPLFWQHLSIPSPPVPEDLKKKDKKGKMTILKPLYMYKIWDTKDLKKIIDPHRKIIKSIKIYGVTDAIVQYILLQCHRLEELALYGWVTLSNHAFPLPACSNLKLRKLGFIGVHGFPNITTIDAFVLTQLLLVNHSIDGFTGLSQEKLLRMFMLLKSRRPLLKNQHVDFTDRNNYQNNIKTT